jgi:hypothetical protein
MKRSIIFVIVGAIPIGLSANCPVGVVAPGYKIVEGSCTSGIAAIGKNITDGNCSGAKAHGLAPANAESVGTNGQGTYQFTCTN